MVEAVFQVNDDIFTKVFYFWFVPDFVKKVWSVEWRLKVDDILQLQDLHDIELDGHCSGGCEHE